MFGVLTPHPSLNRNQLDGLGSPNDLEMRLPRYPEGGATDGHFRNLKMIPDPPNLEEWRQKLFDVDATITLTEDEYVHPTRKDNPIRSRKELTFHPQIPDILSACR